MLILVEHKILLHQVKPDSLIFLQSYKFNDFSFKTSISLQP